jgi:histidinol-phosphate/aromatic aminotransferase/cobyric acid decarboxylase-like protein
MTPTADAPPPGDHGGDAARVAAALGIDVSALLDLSVSLNPFAPDPGAFVARHLDAVGRYPDPAEATAALADAVQIDPDRLLLTNGGSEAIALVAAELGAGHVDEPDFSLYRRHLAVTGPDGPRWRSNPHNPTGRLAGANEQAAVWDEAFYPMATGAWTRGDAERGAWVVGSLTKLLAAPGLRIGYVIGPADDPAAMDRVRRRQPEWSVNSLASAVLAPMLAEVDLMAWAAALRSARAQLVDLLRGHGLEPQPSDANWVLVDAPGLRTELIPHGVLVRDAGSFGLDGFARVAVPHPDQLDRLDHALHVSHREARPQGRIPSMPTTGHTPPSSPTD